MRRLNVAELTADTDTALQYEAEVKNYFQTLESIEEDKMVEPMQIAARWKEYCEELFEANNNYERNTTRLRVVATFIQYTA